MTPGRSKSTIILPENGEGRGKSTIWRPIVIGGGSANADGGSLLISKGI